MKKNKTYIYKKNSTTRRRKARSSQLHYCRPKKISTIQSLESIHQIVPAHAMKNLGFTKNNKNQELIRPLRTVFGEAHFFTAWMAALRGGSQLARQWPREPVVEERRGRAERREGGRQWLHEGEARVEREAQPEYIGHFTTVIK